MNYQAFEDATAFTYRLYLHENIEHPGKSVPSLMLAERTQTVLQKDSREYDIDLNGLRFERKAYQPGCIMAEMQVTFHRNAKGDDTAATLSQEDLQDYLLLRRVTLSIAPKDNDEEETVIAEGYYVYEISVRMVRDSKKSMMFVKLTINSMDKLMTLNPYSKAYVVKRLGADILTSESKLFGFGSALVKTYCGNLQNLVYQQPGKGDGNSEFIQPYLVQYNEPFYDFLSRTANRCGELLMFEDGRLILGMPEKGEAVAIRKYASVTWQNTSRKPLSIKPFTRDSVKSDKEGEFNDSPVEKDKNGYPQGVFGTDYTCNAALAHDDYIFPMVKDKFSSFGRALGMYDAKSAITKLSLDLFSQLVSNTSDPLSGAIAIGKNLGIAYGLNLWNARSVSSSANTAGNKYWIDGYKDKPQQTDGTHTVPFATVSKDGWVKLAYYAQIRAEEEAQQKRMVCVDMGTNFLPVKLGDIVTIDKLPGRYVVIHIAQESGKRKGGEGISQSQVIYAVPMMETDVSPRVVPPLHHQPAVRESGPQTAFIVSNVDPKHQGRVRIAFPWQAVGDPQRKLELEQAKANLKRQTETTEKALAKHQRQQQLLDMLKARNKALSTILSTMEGEADVRKQKELLAKALDDNRRRQSAILTRMDVIDKELNEKEPKSLAAQISAVSTELSRELGWQDFMGVGASTVTLGRLGLLKAKEAILQKKKVKLEDERLKLASEIELLRLSEKDLSAYEGSGSVSPVEFLKTKHTIRKTNDIATAREHVKEAQQEQERAQKAEASAKEVVGKLTKKWNEQLLEVASPWVRVAMPMATEEGGVWMKPAPGDEVLVNFDSDNVERPYVVGSLYSKEHVDPQQNMIIKSPSGQKITFKVAKNDGDFIQTLTPMLSKLGSFIPVLGDKLTLGKDARKLCGGISISDEFGMFSVDMSSSGRSVKVKSPFGTVGVSAFTGITISAPNGDIKIRGKNVSIEAGNNLKLLSGANVTDENSAPDPEEKANAEKQAEESKMEMQERTSTKLSRWASAAGSGIAWAAGMGVESGLATAKEKIAVQTTGFQIVDMQLLRCLAEVFLRPIEGTLLVKSKNYLMLEAGKGKAEVPIEQYSRTWQDFKGLERDPAKEMFFAKTTAYVKRIDQKIGQFCDDYAKLRKDALQKQENYIVYLNTVWKKGDSENNKPMVKWDGFKAAKKEFKKNDKDFKGGTVDMSKFEYRNFKDQEQGRHFLKGVGGQMLTSVKEVKAYIMPAAEAYAEACWALHRLVLGFDTVFTDETIKAVNKATLGTTSHKDTKWIDDVFKKAIFEEEHNELWKLQDKWAKRFGDVASGPKDAFLDRLSPVKTDVFMNPTAIKRRLVALFLLELYKADGNAIKPEEGIGPTQPGKLFKLGYTEVSEALLNEGWADVSALGPKQRVSFFKRLGSFLADWSGVKKAWSPIIDTSKPKLGWERKVWNGKGGKIIFSDKKNATYTVNGENIETWKHAALGNEEGLKQAISGIK